MDANVQSSDVTHLNRLIKTEYCRGFRKCIDAYVPSKNRNALPHVYSAICSFKISPIIAHTLAAGIGRLASTIIYPWFVSTITSSNVVPFNK